MPSSANSAAKRALPATLSGPSMREIGWPIRPCLWRASGSGWPPGIQLSGASATTFFTAACMASLDEGHQAVSRLEASLETAVDGHPLAPARS